MLEEVDGCAKEPDLLELYESHGFRSALKKRALQFPGREEGAQIGIYIKPLLLFNPNWIIEPHKNKQAYFE